MMGQEMFREEKQQPLIQSVRDHIHHGGGSGTAWLISEVYRSIITERQVFSAAK